VVPQHRRDDAAPRARALPRRGSHVQHIERDEARRRRQLGGLTAAARLEARAELGVDDREFVVED
jgi:hypothetical protein